MDENNTVAQETKQTPALRNGHAYTQYAIFWSPAAFVLLPNIVFQLADTFGVYASPSTPGN